MWPEGQWEALKKIAWDGDIKHTKPQTHKHTDIATTRPTRPRGPSWWKYKFYLINCQSSWYHKITPEQINNSGPANLIIPPSWWSPLLQASAWDGYTWMSPLVYRLLSVLGHWGEAPLVIWNNDMLTWRLLPRCHLSIAECWWFRGESPAGSMTCRFGRCEGEQGTIITELG